MTQSSAGRSSSISAAKSWAKRALVGFLPAHVRFIRAGRSFLKSGEREVHLLPQLVEGGTVAFDVGAHIGDYTYALCNAVGSRGRVIAIEPLPDLADRLKRATSRLRLPVTVIQTALSAQAGEADILVPRENGRLKQGWATLEPRSVQGRTCRVPVKRLDDVAANIDGRISFMKIDVEGHELQVLRGATDTIGRHRPNLLIEIEQRHSSLPIDQTFDFLKSLNYGGFYLDMSRSLQPIETFDANVHQPPNGIAAPGSYYVSNFIFRPKQ